MGYTLDQLLDATGLDGLSGGNLSKEAAAPPEHNLSKLAEELRRASEASSDGTDARELVEKTAAVAVLERTLEEISIIDGHSAHVEKTAAPTGPKARFIKEAFEAGHSPVDIAAFLEKEGGIGDRIGRGIQSLRTGRAARSAQRAGQRAGVSGDRARSQLAELLRQSERLPPAKKEALLSRLRGRFSDQTLSEVVQDTGLSRGYGKLSMMKTIRKNTAQAAAGAPAGAPAGVGNYAASASIGGKSVGLTKKQVKAMKGPAAYGAAGLAGGLALSRRGNSKPSSGGRGPVIVTT